MNLLPVSRFARRTIMPMLVVATFSALSVGAASANGILYWGTQPAGKPAFGQTVMVTGIISRDDGGPVANQIVQLWFSGRHGVRAGSYTTRTDRLGRYSVLMTIPWNWRYGIQGDPTWVDLNVSCPAIYATKLFRVRDK